MAIKCKQLLTTFTATSIDITAFQIYYKMFHYSPDASAVLLLVLVFPCGSANVARLPVCITSNILNNLLVPPSILLAQCKKGKAVSVHAMLPMEQRYTHSSTYF